MTKEKPGGQCCDNRPHHLGDEIKASLEAATGPANPDSQRYRGVVMSTTDVALRPKSSPSVKPRLPANPPRRALAVTRNL
jgi:hypothetical protein